MKNFKKTLGERIKEYRLKRGFSQNVLTVLTKIPTASISRFEKGDRAPNALNLKILAEALDISIDYLVGTTDIDYGEG